MDTTTNPTADRYRDAVVKMGVLSNEGFGLVTELVNTLLCALQLQGDRPDRATMERALMAIKEEASAFTSYVGIQAAHVGVGAPDIEAMRMDVFGADDEGRVSAWAPPSQGGAPDRAADQPWQGLRVGERARQFLALMDKDALQVGDGTDSRPVWIGVDAEAGRVFKVYANGLAQGFGNGKMLVRCGVKVPGQWSVGDGAQLTAGQDMALSNGTQLRTFRGAPGPTYSN